MSKAESVKQVPSVKENPLKKQFEEERAKKQQEQQAVVPGKINTNPFGQKTAVEPPKQQEKVLSSAPKKLETVITSSAPAKKETVI